MLPPLEALHQPERGWMLQDFDHWEQSLPAPMRSFAADDASADEGKVLPLRRAL
jgi:hypothetical protein